MPTKSSSIPVSRFLPSDPRYYQIAVLASLLVYGVGWLSLISAVVMLQFCSARFSSPSFSPEDCCPRQPLTRAAR
jgi:hypothetical protein